MAGGPAKRPIPEGPSDSSTDGRHPIAEEDEIISSVSGDEEEIDDTDASSSECYRIRRGYCSGSFYRKRYRDS